MASTIVIFNFALHWKFPNRSCSCFHGSFFVCTSTYYRTLAEWTVRKVAHERSSSFTAWMSSFDSNWKLKIFSNNSSSLRCITWRSFISFNIEFFNCAESPLLWMVFKVVHIKWIANCYRILRIAKFQTSLRCFIAALCRQSTETISRHLSWHLTPHSLHRSPCLWWFTNSNTCIWWHMLRFIRYVSSLMTSSIMNETTPL